METRFGALNMDPITSKTIESPTAWATVIFDLDFYDERGQGGVSRAT